MAGDGQTEGLAIVVDEMNRQMDRKPPPDIIKLQKPATLAPTKKSVSRLGRPPKWRWRRLLLCPGTNQGRDTGLDHLKDKVKGQLAGPNT